MRETEPETRNLENNLLSRQSRLSFLKGLKIPRFTQRRGKLGAAVALVVFLFLVFFGIVPGVSTYLAARKLEGSAKNLVTSVRSQNLEQTKSSLSSVKQDLILLDKNLAWLGWTRFIPGLGVYWSDANHLTTAGILGIEAAEIIIPTLEPYADILGFDPSTGSGQVGDGAKTAEDRINFVVETIDDILPKVDVVGEKLGKASTELSQINPNRYPEKLGQRKIRENLSTGIFLVSEAARLLTDGKPLLQNLPYLLGIDESRTYLVIFQNDKELRPTGGFMTAYSLVRVRDGKIEPVSSDDIYNLDRRYRATIDAPDPFLSHIKQPYLANPGWRLRDMNWSPDFRQSLELFMTEAQKAGLGKVDGVIAVDTEVLVSLLSVIGRIGVPGYGNYSAEIDPRCDCPQVIYELETYADVERPIVWDPVSGKIVYGSLVDNRKAILGPLVNSVLANALGQPKDKLPALFSAATASVLEKHVLFYMFDAKTQEGFEVFGLAGRIKNFSGDYLAINDANLGGRKSNLYVEQEVKLEIKKRGNTLEHLLEITYKNPKPHDGWLNSVLPNWTRIYLPKGAKIVEVSGLEEQEDPYEELGKTVQAGFFQLRPQGVVKVTLRYETQGAGDVKLLIQKQPGTDEPLYHLVFDGKTQEFKLTADKEIRF